MSETDPTTAGAIGAAIVGAAVAVKEIFSRRKKPDSEPPPSSTLAVRVGRLYDDLGHVKQELSTMRQDIATRLALIEESVDELSISRAKTDELLPIIKEQLHDLRQDLRDARARSNDR